MTEQTPGTPIVEGGCVNPDPFRSRDHKQPDTDTPRVAKGLLLVGLWVLSAWLAVQAAFILGATGSFAVFLGTLIVALWGGTRFLNWGRRPR